MSDISFHCNSQSSPLTVKFYQRWKEDCMQRPWKYVANGSDPVTMMLRKRCEQTVKQFSQRSLSFIGPHLYGSTNWASYHSLGWQLCWKLLSIKTTVETWEIHSTFRNWVHDYCLISLNIHKALANVSECHIFASVPDTIL